MHERHVVQYTTLDDNETMTGAITPSQESTGRSLNPGSMCSSASARTGSKRLEFSKPQKVFIFLNTFHFSFTYIGIVTWSEYIDLTDTMLIWRYGQKVCDGLFGCSFRKEKKNIVLCVRVGSRTGLCTERKYPSRSRQSKKFSCSHTARSKVCGRQFTHCENSESASRTLRNPLDMVLALNLLG